MNIGVLGADRLADYLNAVADLQAANPLPAGGQRSPDVGGAEWTAQEVDKLARRWRLPIGGAGHQPAEYAGAGVCC